MTDNTAPQDRFAIGGETVDNKPSTLRLVLAQRDLVIGLVLFGVIVLLAVFAPLLTPHDPFFQNLSARRVPPVWDLLFNENSKASWVHPLGTDQIGRDFMARMFYGARISLMVAVLSTAIAAVIGIAMGLAGGYFGKTADAVVNFIIVSRLSLPTVIVALAVVSLYGGSLYHIILVLGLLQWDKFAIVTRAETFKLRNSEYIKAAKAIGCSTVHILLRQLLPNLSSSLIVIATYEMGAVILLEAALSFLGMGVQPPTPSWGLMLSEARGEILFNSWMIVIPGIAVFVLVLSINYIGDGLRDIAEARGVK
jgi:peptide/nickel transport system permease protein